MSGFNSKRKMANSRFEQEDHQLALRTFVAVLFSFIIMGVLAAVL